MSPLVPGWLRELGAILRETVAEWLADDIPARGAALAYYVILSLGPFLILLVGVGQYFLSAEEISSAVTTSLADHVGQRAAETVSTILEQATVPDLLSPGSVLTVALLLFGATAAFANIHGSLDAIWGVESESTSKRQIALDLLRVRARGFVVMVFTGLVLLVSFFVTSAAGVFAEPLGRLVPHGWILIQSLDAALSLLVLGTLFGIVYRTLPSVEIRGPTVWVGAFATAFLFVIGKWIVATILAGTSWTSYYGPGASVVTFLAWIYFSAQIFFFGAEFTQVWSRRRGGVMAEE